MGSDGDDEPFSLAAALGQEKEPEPAAPDGAAAQDQKEKEGEKQGDEKARSRSRSSRREKKHKKDRRRDRRRSRSRDRSRDDRRRDRRSRSRGGGRSRDRRRSRDKRRSRSRDRDKRRSRSRRDDRKRDDRRKSGGREKETQESGSRSPRSGRMYTDLAGREFRDQRSRQYPSRSRSFGKLRKKKKKDEDEEEPSAAMMIQQMLAQKTNPMLVSMLGPTAASMGGTAAMAPGMGLTGVFNTGATAVKPEEEPSKCLLLENVVTVEELKDDEEYEELLEDMKLEAEKHGTVVKLSIPRPAADGTTVPGCGKVYIMFDFLEAAQRAKKALDRRKFGENVVKCIYMQEAKFLANELD